MAGVFFITLLPLYPVFYFLLAHPKRWRTSFKLQKWWDVWVMRLCGISLKITGQENFPSGGYVVVANHASYIDTFLMYRVIPNYFVFMGMAALQDWPLFGVFFKSGMNIPVDRGSVQKSARAFLEASKRLDQQVPVAIYPEGGIKEIAPKISPFKSGPFKMAVSHGVPIVPVVLFNSHVIMESTQHWGTPAAPGKCYAKVLKPIETSHLTEEDLIHLRQDIQRTISNEVEYFLANNKVSHEN